MEANAKKPKAKARPKLNPTENAALKRLEHDLITDDGIVPATKGRHAIHCLTVIGTIEGHTLSPDAQKTTKYEHVIPQLVDIEEDPEIETGMQNCGTVTICIGEQIDISILTTMLVTKLGVPHVISKAASEVHGEVLKRLGAEVVYPEADMAVRIGKRLISGNLLDYIALGDGVEVRRITVGGRMLGKSVRTLDLRKAYGINIIAVEHGQQTNVEFSADYTFKEGDTVAVIGKVGKIDKFEKEM